MPRHLTEQEVVLENILEVLTKEVEDLRGEALTRASHILHRTVTLPSLNGIIGGKNNTYVDSVRTQFLGFDDFFAQWLKGLNDIFTREKKQALGYSGTFDWFDRASFKNVLLLKDPLMFEYARKSLEKNFYKHLYQRVRMKPDEDLWSVWFGYKIIFGLLIAPVKLPSGWTNDKSEIRRVPYNYWTIGHIMSTGLIDPDSEAPVTFPDLDYFFTFYKSILIRLTSSQYEKEIGNRYIQYLKDSIDIKNEPFLIPEFRYKGLTHKHLYRLDYTVLNQHTIKFIGYEISPASTHMAISGLKSKQATVNTDLKENWEYEMEKRNKYFETFGITTITFTDKNLLNIDGCFDIIKQTLSERPIEKPTLEDQIKRLQAFT